MGVLVAPREGNWGCEMDFAHFGYVLSFKNKLIFTNKKYKLPFLVSLVLGKDIACSCLMGRLRSQLLFNSKLFSAEEAREATSPSVFAGFSSVCGPTTWAHTAPWTFVCCALCFLKHDTRVCFKSEFLGGMSGCSYLFYIKDGLNVNLPATQSPGPVRLDSEL